HFSIPERRHPNDIQVPAPGAADNGYDCHGLRGLAGLRLCRAGSGIDALGRSLGPYPGDRHERGLRHYVAVPATDPPSQAGWRAAGRRAIHRRACSQRRSFDADARIERRRPAVSTVGFLDLPRPLLDFVDSAVLGTLPPLVRLILWAVV